MSRPFEKRAVLFLDFLGFKANVQSCETDTNQIDRIYTVLSIVKKHFDTYKDIKKIQFSDSLVISFKAESEGAILELLGRIQSLTKKVISNGFILRGGLAYGNLYHDKDYIFGTAMNTAYELESKKAIVPRIIIQREIIEIGANYLPKFFNEGMENYVFNYISKDNDGEFYIDYFQKGVDTFWDVKNRDKRFILHLKKTIEDGLLNENMSVKLKYLWMKEKFNHMVIELKQNTQNTIGGFTIGTNKTNSFYKNLDFIK